MQADIAPQTVTAEQMYTAGNLILATSKLEGTCIRTGVCQPFRISQSGQAIVAYCSPQTGC